MTQAEIEYVASVRAALSDFYDGVANIRMSEARHHAPGSMAETEQSDPQWSVEVGNAASIGTQLVESGGEQVDRYHREVGRIFLGERFINLEMVRDGFAWRYVQYDKPGEFTAAENDAHEHRRGLWADPDPVPPWEWRKVKRAKSAH
jgi:hypothetical protein